MKSASCWDPRRSRTQNDPVLRGRNDQNSGRNAPKIKIGQLKTLIKNHDSARDPRILIKNTAQPLPDFCSRFREESTGAGSGRAIPQ
jgi:hypothetical protein